MRITTTRDDLLDLLRQAPPGTRLRPMDLGASDGSNHSRILAGLVRDGLVERNTRRVTLLRPSYVYRLRLASSPPAPQD